MEIKNIDIEEIHEIFQYDTIWQIMERINNRPRKFAQQLKEYIQTTNLSPISQAITFELIKRGSETNDPKVAIYNEFLAQMAFWNHREMKEGIRALLLDKDKNPKWSHSSIKEVTQQDIDFFFNPQDKLSIGEVYDIDKFPTSRFA